MLFGHDGSAGPNVGYLFYLYDPALGQFVFHADLSDLTQTQINPHTKTISAASRDGCCSHSSEEYRFIGGQLTLTASHEETMSASNPDRTTVTEGKLVNGKWREKNPDFRSQRPVPGK
jgi:hypothetical protein